ncbi:MAG: riboflavin synthase [Hyphomicrobiaceae bacterium]|jgi:riboflavin synthase
MFTGIVQDLGRVRSVEALAQGRRLTVESAVAGADIELGESIAVDGACMTVVEWGEGWFAVDVSAESLRCTTLGAMTPGHAVNVERSMTMADRLGGHMVSGHVDGTGEVLSIRPEGESYLFTFGAGPSIAELLIEKGSITVDGISLTCFACADDRFDVAVIPHTFAVTTLGSKKPGDAVNLENDLFGKYVQKLVDQALVRRLGTQD